jgi:hypothetical protein
LDTVDQYIQAHGKIVDILVNLFSTDSDFPKGSLLSFSDSSSPNQRRAPLPQLFLTLGRFFLRVAGAWP